MLLSAVGLLVTVCIMLSIMVVRIGDWERCNFKFSPNFGLISSHPFDLIPQLGWGGNTE